jgi:hypothetical protein
VSDFIYYAYRPGMVQGLGTIYRVDSEFWTGGGAIQEVYNRQTGEWVPTDMLVYRVVHGDVWLERLGFDPSTELVNESSGSVVPLKNTVEYLFASPKYTEKVVTVHTLREVKEVIPSTLEKMKTSGRRWVVILETSKDPTMYVQVLITAAGSIWAECVSNEFLEEGDQLDNSQCELLPTLGWEWPGPPASPNWHFHDELLNTGSAIAGLIDRTLWRVFGVDDEDTLRVILMPLAEQEELVDQR